MVLWLTYPFLTAQIKIRRGHKFPIEFSCFFLKFRRVAVLFWVSIKYKLFSCFKDHMSGNVRKVHSKLSVCPTKTQISLRIRAVWSESSLSAWRNFAFFAIQNALSEDSDQTARMRRLIWIFAARAHVRRYILKRCYSYKSAKGSNGEHNMSV